MSTDDILESGLFQDLIAEAIHASMDRETLKDPELQQSLEQMRQGAGRVVRLGFVGMLHSFVGMLHSGEGDLAERAKDIVRDA